MPFWDYIHFGRPPGDDDDADRQYRNLQEGLMQIASQTCNILVQVNNTNNISYGNNATNVQYNNFGPHDVSFAGAGGGGGGGGGRSSARGGRGRSGSDDDVELSDVLIPASAAGAGAGSPSTALGIRGSTKNLFSHYRHRLSTVLENNTPAGDDDFELWDQNQMLRSEQQNLYSSRWGPGGWCRPSCIPITVILTLIVLVVLLPLLENTTDPRTAYAGRGMSSPYVCSDRCRIQLVESIPEGLPYPAGAPQFMSTYDAWQWLIANANRSLDIGTYYWALRAGDVYNHSSAAQGDRIFQAILRAGTAGGIRVRIAQSQPTHDQPSPDTEVLVKRKAALVRSVNFKRLMQNGGVLHTKLWVVDGQHAYIGSANNDWRSLTQVKELGVLIQNCSCLVRDVAKIFAVYWMMGKEEAKLPPAWPAEVSTKINYTTPMRVQFNEAAYTMNGYFASSPPPLSPVGRAQDIDAILRVIGGAEKFVYVAVMDYLPLMVYSPKLRYWPIIDDALRAAAIENKVQVRLLVSWWEHSRPAEDYFLRSLQALTQSYPGVDVQVKRFIVKSSDDQKKIPFARVNHNKYMVTDRSAYIGTSNWSGDYFTNTAGIGLVLHDDEPQHDDTHGDRADNQTETAESMRNSTAEQPKPKQTLRSDLEAVFERDWNSIYALDLVKA